MNAFIENVPYQFAVLDKGTILDYWGEAEPIIERALAHDYSGMTTAQILGRILMDDLQLIVVAPPAGGDLVAVMTLEYVNRRDRICHCMTFSGDDMKEWLDQWLEVWKILALEAGCKRLSIKGRKGWEKFAPRYGFEHEYTLMSLDLERKQ